MDSYLMILFFFFVSLFFMKESMRFAEKGEIKKSNGYFTLAFAEMCLVADQAILPQSSDSPTIFIPISLGLAVVAGLRYLLASDSYPIIFKFYTPKELGKNEKNIK